MTQGQALSTPKTPTSPRSKRDVLATKELRSSDEPKQTTKQEESTSTSPKPQGGLAAGSVGAALGASLGSLTLAGLAGGPFGLMLGAVGGAVGGYYISKLPWGPDPGPEGEAPSDDEEEQEGAEEEISEDLNLLSIADIKEEDEVEDVCYVDATITEVVTQGNPIYLVCSNDNCAEKLSIEYSSAFCSTCSSPITQPHFGLLLKVEDDQDSTWFICKRKVSGNAVSVDKMQAFLDSKTEEWKKLFQEYLYETYRFKVKPISVLVNEYEIMGEIQHVEFIEDLDRMLQDVHRPLILARRLSVERADDEEPEEDFSQFERRFSEDFTQFERRFSEDLADRTCEDCERVGDFEIHKEGKDAEGRHSEERDFEDPECADKCSCPNHHRVGAFLRPRDY